MKATFAYFSVHHVCFIFLKVISLTTEKLMVTTPTGHLVARVGGQAELSCQMSPPHSVEYMEVRWFRGDNSKLVYQYRGGHGMNGEAAPEYVNRTEFMKEDIGKGKVALRIHNISVSDDEPYQCSFNDSGFNDVAFINLSVVAFALKTQIHVQSPGYDGFIVECSSEGWFPRPQMEWRDSNWNVVPYSSISYSQDEDRFFYMKMTLLLRSQKTEENITCCVFNPQTGEEKQTNLIITSALFYKKDMECLIFGFLGIFIILCLFDFLIFCLMKKGHKSRCRSHFSKLIIPVMQFLCFLVFSGIIVNRYLQLRNRVSISDHLFSLYNSWMMDMAIVIGFLVIFFSFTTPLLLKHQC